MGLPLSNKAFVWNKYFWKDLSWYCWRQSSLTCTAWEVLAYLCLCFPLNVEGNLPQSENKGCAKIKSHYSFRRGHREELRRDRVGQDALDQHEYCKNVSLCSHSPSLDFSLDSAFLRKGERIHKPNFISVTKWSLDGNFQTQRLWFEWDWLTQEFIFARPLLRPWVTMFWGTKALMAIFNIEIIWWKQCLLIWLESELKDFSAKYLGFILKFLWRYILQKLSVDGILNLLHRKFQDKIFFSAFQIKLFNWRCSFSSENLEFMYST